MLSDSKAYTGGKLEVKRGRGGKNPGSMYTAGLVGKRLVSDVKLEAGDAVVFPAKKVFVPWAVHGLRRLLLRVFTERLNIVKWAIVRSKIFSSVIGKTCS